MTIFLLLIFEIETAFYPRYFPFLRKVENTPFQYLRVTKISYKDAQGRQSQSNHSDVG